MRRFVWGVVGLALAGCAGGAGRGADDEIVDPAFYDEMKMSDLGTDLTRGVSKTIDWQQIGTEKGATYCAGAVEVDRIVRHDVDDFYSVVVRLKAVKAELQKLQWQIRFYSMQGDPLIGFNDSDAWKSVLIEPLGFTTITESARVKGAVGFRLFVRNAGATDTGLQDAVQEPE